MADALPLVSIIVPAYNYGHFIGESLQSILEQTYSNWECIVVDNGSTDNTKEIVDNFASTDSRFNYIKIAHTTISATRNAGLQEAKGEFIQFVDSDDQIASGKLCNQIELFREHPDVDLVYSHARFYDSGNNGSLRRTYDGSDKEWMPVYSGFSWNMLHAMLEKNLFVISSPLIRSDVIKEIGGFLDEQNWVEDWDFYFRMLASNKRVLYDPSPDSWSLIRVHNTSLSRNKSMMLEQSLKVRIRAATALKKITGLNDKDDIIETNSRHIRHIHRTLSYEYAADTPRKSAGHALSFAMRDRDFRLLLKAGFFWLINKPVPLTQT